MRHHRFWKPYIIIEYADGQKHRSTLVWTLVAFICAVTVGSFGQIYLDEKVSMPLAVAALLVRGGSFGSKLSVVVATLRGAFSKLFKQGTLTVYNFKGHWFYT